jgi:hypothetical protein
MHDAIIHVPLIESFGEIADVPQNRLALLQADGTAPHVCKGRLGRIPSGEEVAALGWVEECSTTTHGRNGATVSTFYRHGDGSRFMHINRGGDETAYATIAATSAEVAAATLRDLAVDCSPIVEAVDPALVPVQFHWHSGGVRSRTRTVETRAFEDIADNYPSRTRDALDRLHRFQPVGDVPGRLLLFHGAPGTGKTTAVRSLARSWAPWCSTAYVIDPEALFGVPEYLIEVAIDASSRRSTLLAFDDDEESEHRSGGPEWKLVVVEDVDELIRGDAKLRTGQALARLLNMTDGLLGQGLRTMFLLTTNEPMSELHPAISRPGRCLANIEFHTFNRVEAESWLAHHGGTGPVGDTNTLAQLYAASNTGVIQVADEQAVHHHGTYL